MTTLRATSSMVVVNSTPSDLSFRATSLSGFRLDPRRPYSPASVRPKQCVAGDNAGRERSAVVSRPRMKAPASQAGAACVPSSQSFNAAAD